MTHNPFSRWRIAGLIALLALGFFALGATAEARVPMPPAMPQVIYEPCPGYDPERVAGCFARHGDDCDHLADCVYVTERGDRSTLTHELGHAYARQVIEPNEGRKIRFIRMLGFKGTKWDRGYIDADGYYSGRRSPGERFADAYDLCSRRLPRANQSIDTTYGWQPSRRKLAHVCKAIRRTAR